MDYAEANQRNFHEYWMQLMSAGTPPHGANGNGASATAARGVPAAP
jgi:hypothetical protein